MLSFAGTSVFANTPATSQTDMFADVEGSALSDKEMDDADGEGVAGAVAGAIIDGGIEAASQYLKYGKIVNKKRIVGHALVGAVAGGISCFGPFTKVAKAARLAKRIRLAKTAKKAARIANSARKYSGVKSVARKIPAGFAVCGAHCIVNKYTRKSRRH